MELKSLLEATEVKTARDVGWQTLENGALLEKANDRFDVLLTMDKAMPSQQVLEKFDVGVVLIKARSNRIADLTDLKAKIQAAIKHCARGSATVVS